MAPFAALYRLDSIIQCGGLIENIEFEDFQLNLKLLQSYSCYGQFEVKVSYRVLPTSFHNSTKQDQLDSIWLKSMSIVYGKLHYWNWIILLKFLKMSKGIHFKLINKIVVIVFYYLDKKYNKTLQDTLGEGFK